MFPPWKWQPFAHAFMRVLRTSCLFCYLFSLWKRRICQTNGVGFPLPWADVFFLVVLINICTIFRAGICELSGRCYTCKAICSVLIWNFRQGGIWKGKPLLPLGSFCSPSLQCLILLHFQTNTAMASSQTALGMDILINPCGSVRIII